MKVGDRIRAKPTSNGSLDKNLVDQIPPQLAKVTYIHPAGRYYVLEFTAERTGEKWRESRYYKGNDR